MSETNNNQIITSKTILEDYNPVHQVFSSISKEVGVEFPLDDQDYLQLVQATLSMVPVVGDLVSSVFTIIWTKFFPEQEKYVSKEAFEKRISQLYIDMEKKIGMALDAAAANWCNSKFETLLKGGELFKEAINVYIATKKSGSYSGTERAKVSTFIVAHHAVFTKSLNDALIFFSNPKYVKFTIKLYLETAAIYLSFLKDTLVFGDDWGLPSLYINGSFGVKSIKQKIHDATADVFKTYKLFIQEFMKDKNLGGKIPDWSILVATYLHGDMTLYPHTVHWLKRHSSNHGLTSFLLPTDIIKPHIFSIDATQVGIMCEGLSVIYQPNKVDGQTCNYIMNTYDYHLVKGYQRKKTLVYFTLYDQVNRTMAFRFYMTNIEKNYNDFNLIVRELDPEKVDNDKKPGYHPDDAFKIKLKEYNQKMKNTKPFVSAYTDVNTDMYESEPITFESSKCYYVEIISSSDINLGSYYHRIDILCGGATDQSDKLAFEEGDRPSINIDVHEKGSLIDFAKLGAEYDAAEAAFTAKNAANSVVTGVKDFFSKPLNF